MYWIMLMFSIGLYAIATIIIIASLNFIPGMVAGVLIILLAFFYGSFPRERGTTGKNTIYAKLYENCYRGYVAPLGPSRVYIEFTQRPKLIIVRYAYYFSSGIFIPLDLPWQGWNLIFINNGNVYWGPNVSTVNYVRRDHIFTGSVVKRFRELNLDVEYALLDPQYMGEFIDELKKYASIDSPLSKILEMVGLQPDGTLRDRKPEKIYELPYDLHRADLMETYEDLLPRILSRY